MIEKKALVLNQMEDNGVLAMQLYGHRVYEEYGFEPLWPPIPCRWIGCGAECANPAEIQIMQEFVKQKLLAITDIVFVCGNSISEMMFDVIAEVCHRKLAVRVAYQPLEALIRHIAIESGASLPVDMKTIPSGKIGLSPVQLIETTAREER